MPEISRFFGIVITMYHKDHPPPHFHATQGQRQAQIAVETGEVLQGGLPRRSLALVEKWRQLHKDELIANWTLRESLNPLPAIEPMK